MLSNQHCLKPLFLLVASTPFIPLHALAAPDTITLEASLAAPAQATPNSATETALTSVCPSLAGVEGGQISAPQTSLLNTCTLRDSASQSELDVFHEQISPQYASSLSNNINVGNNTSKIKNVSTRSRSRNFNSRSNTKKNSAAYNGNTYGDNTYGGNTYGDYGDSYQDNYYFYNASFSPSNLASSSDDNFDNLDELLARIDVFTSFYALQSSKDATTQDSGYDNDTVSFLFGGNYRLTNKFILGTALELAYSELSLEPQEGSIEANNYNVSVFGSYQYKPEWIFDVSIYAGFFDYDTTRDVEFTLAGTPTVGAIDSSTDAIQMGFSLGTSYSWSFSNGIDLTALSSIKFIDSEVDGYEEKGQTGYELIVESQSYDNASTEIGLETRKAFGFGWGALIPQIGLTYVYDFDDESIPVSATFVVDPDGTAFGFSTEERDQDYFNLLLGSYIGLTRGLSGFVQLESVLGLDDYSSVNFSMGIRTELK